MAAQAGVIYSLAYGDQPAMICDLVDWARTCGFPVVAAGRGHKWLPHFCESTPETVWGYYGLTPEQAVRGGLNPKMFNSFLDGSKPAIESTAVANATGLAVPSNGLLYPPASVEDIPFVTRPLAEGGVLEQKGMVEVISSLEKDGRAIPYEIRKGVWVVFEAATATEYGITGHPALTLPCRPTAAGRGTVSGLCRWCRKWMAARDWSRRRATIHALIQSRSAFSPLGMPTARSNSVCWNCSTRGRRGWRALTSATTFPVADMISKSPAR